MPSQNLREVFSHTKDCLVEVKVIKCFTTMSLNQLTACVAFLPLKVHISLNQPVEALLLQLPFLISYRKFLNCCYKSTIASISE